METLARIDLFFFITGMAVILITIFWLVFISILLFFGYKILKNLKIISSLFKDQIERIFSDSDKVRKTIIEDIASVREKTKNSSLFFLKLFNIFSKKSSENKGRDKNKKKSNDKRKNS